MADLNIRLHIRLSRGAFRWVLLTALLGVCAGELASESFTMTSYYPAPSGIYTQMITTGRTYLARDAGGSVGIGTTNPLSKAHVVGQVFIDNSGGSHGLFPGPALVVDGNASAALLVRDVGANNIAAFDGSSLRLFNAAGAESIRLNRAGSIGVGTSSPGYALTVQPAAANSDSISWKNGASEVGRLGIDGATTNGWLGLWGAGTLKVQISAGASNTYFNGANVGIGTTSPTAKLHVAGTLRIVDGSQAVGRVLTSGGDGTAIWSNPVSAFACKTVWTAAATGVNNAVCPAGYLPTGGGCQGDNPMQDSRPLNNGPGPSSMDVTTANWWRCAAFSGPIANPRVWAYVICCK